MFVLYLTEFNVLNVCVRELCCTGVYDKCVYKFDHYCVWIGNCVGGLNHRYFLALLLSLSAMSIHGVWGICKVFSAVLTVYHINTTSGTYHLIKVMYTQLANCCCFQLLLPMYAAWYTLWSCICLSVTSRHSSRLAKLVIIHESAGTEFSGAKDLDEIPKGSYTPVIHHNVMNKVRPSLFYLQHSLCTYIYYIFVNLDMEHCRLL